MKLLVLSERQVQMKIIAGRTNISNNKRSRKMVLKGAEVFLATVSIKLWLRVK